MPTDSSPTNQTADRLLGTRTAALAQRLIALDSSWTAELGHADRPPDATSLAQLHGVAGELRTALDEMRQRAFDLRQVLNRTSDADFDKAISDVNVGLAQNQLPQLVVVAPGAPDQAALSRLTVVRSCDYVVTHADAETTSMRQDLDRLQRGESPVGEFRKAFRCALFLVSIGAAVVAAIGLGGPLPFVALAVAGQFTSAAAGWAASDCPSFLPTIRNEPPAPAPVTPLVPEASAPPAPARRSGLARFLPILGTQGGGAAAFNPHRGTHLALVFLGLVALACASGVVLIVLHHSTATATAAITAMSSLGAAAVGGIAGIVTGTIPHSGTGQDAGSTHGGG